MRKPLWFYLVFYLAGALLLTIAKPTIGRSQSQPAFDGHNSIAWADSFEAAKARAQSERKPILLLHLFGRLDEELC